MSRPSAGYLSRPSAGYLSRPSAGYWALLDTRVAGNRCRIYATEAEATEALEATVQAAREHAERQVQHAIEDARNKLVVVHREWGEQPNAPITRHG